MLKLFTVSFDLPKRSARLNFKEIMGVNFHLINYLGGVRFFLNQKTFELGSSKINFI